MSFNINFISHNGYKMKKIALLALIFSCFTLGAAIAWLIHAPRTVKLLQQQNSNIEIGGSFNLVNHKGEKVSNETYNGKLRLVYFCFTRSRDICPAGMQTLSAVLKGTEKYKQKLAVLFITFEPVHDTPDKLTSYLSNYHSGITGLTGTPVQVRRAIKTYKVFYSRKPGAADGKIPPQINHSTYIYLTDINGKYLEYFYHGTHPDKITKTILKYL